MIVLVDNYDSFSYNLYQMLGEMDRHIAVVRNDEKTVSEIEAMHPDYLCGSPDAWKTVHSASGHPVPHIRADWGNNQSWEIPFPDSEKG